LISEANHDSTPTAIIAEIYTKIILCEKNARNDLSTKLFHLSKLFCVAHLRRAPCLCGAREAAPHIVGWQARAVPYD
jgi:hypothetical protein